MRTPRRLVVRGVNWLGDAVMSIPALLRLRAALPQTHIAILSAEKLADLWRNQPFIDQVLPFSRQQGVGQVSRQLRSGNFDAALIFPNSFRSAFESWLAGIPTRVGYARKFLLTHSIPHRAEHVEMHKKSAGEVRSLVQNHPRKPRQSFPASAHHLHQYLRLVTFFGASEEPVRPRLAVLSSEASAFRSKFALNPDYPKLGLNPGAEYGPAKRWPVERYIEVARQISRERTVEWLIFGGPGDTVAARQIEAGIRQTSAAAVNLAGRTNLRELMTGLSLCQAVLTNDTGPMHLAAAVGTRVIVPFGSTSPELTGPGLPGDTQHRLITGQAPCAPCFLRGCPIDFRCMLSISAQEMSQHLLRALEER